MTVGVLTAEAHAWANTSFASYEFPVSRIDIARFARATGETDPIHFHSASARAAGHADVVAPTMFPYVIRMHASSLDGEVTEDGSPAGDVPPVPTTRAMAGETVVTFGAPIVAGDTITVAKRVADLYEKEGRSGTLVFVEMEFTFTNQRDKLVAREVFTRIYR